MQLKDYQHMTVLEILQEMFADYFDSKVQRIRASFPTTTADPMNAKQLYHGPELCEFSPTTPTELSSLVKSMAKKSCSLDPIHFF